ncbi:MAG: NERD domain-containing protein [Clostridia bacterium]|nr:NERD domain-containing protein [Clostridia bacterium]
MAFEVLINTIKDLISIFLHPLILIPIVIAIAVTLKRNKEYKEGAYYKITNLPFGQVKKDVGRFGEYLIYNNLKKFEKVGAKFLFNVYIPKNESETTEIDVLMICSKGIFVFESKNYSGWIFGSENQKNWYQTLPKGRGKSQKESFYNPVMQNRTHIKHLKTLVGEDVTMHSIIAFSQRCTLKNVEVSSQDVKVIKRDEIFSLVTEICKKESTEILSEEKINELYNMLYPFTQADETLKAKHIDDIKNKLEPKVVETVTEVTQENKTEEVVTKEVDEKEIEEKICPKCGGKLVLKTASRGANAGNQFYGCSNFPKCRYILSDNSKEL